MDRAPNDGEGDKLLFIFDGGQLAQDFLRTIRLEPRELAGYGFHQLAAAEQLLIPRLARRLAATLDAQQRHCSAVSVVT